MILKGRVWKFGDNVNTDEIIAGKRLLTLNFEEIAKYAFEAIKPDFAAKVKPGDIIIAGDNFGCGSSREQAPIVIKKLGVSAVIANYFARIFFRNAINIGLPLIEAPGAHQAIREGDILEINLTAGLIKDLNSNTEIHFKKIPQFLTEILSEGGVINYLKKNGKFKI
ncbi:MAG: 3-isopropylmalate dehydratase small subunit [Candidatus Odinarchaeota archaeon]